MSESVQLTKLLSDVRACRLCENELSHGVNPIVQANEKARILIIGQAPGIRVHESGVPWNDASGDRLRDWLGVRSEYFYSDAVAIMPMGFCYPGKGTSGDLPPRKECAPTWHNALLEKLSKVELTILIGSYAQQFYLKNKPSTLTQTVQEFQSFLPNYFVLPHPSPRNNIWLKRNPWFTKDVLPELRNRVLLLTKQGLR